MCRELKWNGWHAVHSSLDLQAVRVEAFVVKDIPWPLERSDTRPLIDCWSGLIERLVPFQDLLPRP